MARRGFGRLAQSRGRQCLLCKTSPGKTHQRRRVAYLPVTERLPCQRLYLPPGGRWVWRELPSNRRNFVLTAPPAPDPAPGPSPSDDALEDLLVVMETRQLPVFLQDPPTTD